MQKTEATANPLMSALGLIIFSYFFRGFSYFSYSYSCWLSIRGFTWLKTRTVRGGSRHSQHSQLRMSDFPSLMIPIIMLKVMNELRFKTQDKHIFIHYVFKVFISTPSLYSIYFTPFCLCDTLLDRLRWKTTFSFMNLVPRRAKRCRAASCI